MPVLGSENNPARYKCTSQRQGGRYGREVAGSRSSKQFGEASKVIKRSLAAAFGVAQCLGTIKNSPFEGSLPRWARSQLSLPRWRLLPFAELLQETSPKPATPQNAANDKTTINCFNYDFFEFFKPCIETKRNFDTYCVKKFEKNLMCFIG